MSLEEKDKKISDLRALLTQAKAKIEEYKGQLVLKEKEMEEVRRQYDKKIKLCEGDSQNIIKQYEERQLRYQKSLEESNQLVERHQKGMQFASKNYDELIKKIASLYTISTKIFSLAPSKDRDNSDAVEELCEIEKCKEFTDNLEKFSSVSDLQLVCKMLSLLVKNHQLALNKRRQQRIQFLKRETQLQKTVQEQKTRTRVLEKEINSLKTELSEMYLLAYQVAKNTKGISKISQKAKPVKTKKKLTKNF